ncbi:MAG: hypothetical protein JWR74_2144 [Polaromonas sp.]|nr:hypothetical protein [Polaromonas sp.]
MQEQLTPAGASMQADYLMAARIAEGHRPAACPPMTMPLSALLYTQVHAQAPRFFIDHGTVHDRQTGQHLYTEADLHEARRGAAQPVAPIEGWRSAPARMKFKEILCAHFDRGTDDEDSGAGRALMAFDDLAAWQKAQAAAQAATL